MNQGLVAPHPIVQYGMFKFQHLCAFFCLAVAVEMDGVISEWFLLLRTCPRVLAAFED
jgi:hypothetical protein